MHRRYSLVLAAIAALCAAFVVAPAQADTNSSASWDYATGFRVTPGTVIQVASITVDEAVGLCTIDLTATNGQSQHPGNNLIVEENGVAVLTLFGVEDEPFTTTTGSVDVDASAGDVFVVFLESTESRRTSIAGTLAVACTTEQTTTTTGPPETTTTVPDDTTTTTVCCVTTTTESVVTTTTDPPAPPTGSTPPAPGSHEEAGGELSALFGLLGILGLVGSTMLFRRDRAGS
ncbi:MAG TPA: hypothetical protein VIV08_06760 [Acidimicrobiia bacterium]